MTMSMRAPLGHGALVGKDMCSRIDCTTIRFELSDLKSRQIVGAGLPHRIAHSGLPLQQPRYLEPLSSRLETRETGIADQNRVPSRIRYRGELSGCRRMAGPLLIRPLHVYGCDVVSAALKEHRCCETLLSISLDLYERQPS